MENEMEIPALSCSEIGLVQALGKADISTYAGSFFKDNPALYSRFSQRKVLFKQYDNTEFIAQLCDFGKKIDSKPVLFSDDDRALLLISRFRDKLQEYYRFLLPDHEMVKQILDKRLFVELCDNYNLPAPKSFEVKSLEDVNNAATELPFPVIIKPAYKQDWWHSDFEEKVGPYKKAYKCDTPNDLKNLYSKISKINKRAVVQEFVPGDDNQLYSINMFVNDEGSLKGYFLARKKRIYPISAGTGCYIVTVKDEKMTNLAVEITEKLQLKGLLNIQFKVDSRTGEPRLMEIHTRNSYWGYLGCEAGVNLSNLYYCSLTDKKPPSNNSYQKGVKYIDLGKDIKAFFQYKNAGLLNWKDWLKTYRGDFVLGGMLLEDPLPILMNFLFILRRRLPGYNSNSNNETLPT